MDAENESANPLIIPPPPPGTPKKAPTPPPRIERPPVDPESFISMPASVLDSATLRIASTRAERRPVDGGGSDDIVFFPAPAAAPAPVPEPVEEPAPPGEASLPGPTPFPEPTPVPEPVEERASPPPSAPETSPSAVVPQLAWRLELADGQIVELATSALLGRRPAEHPAAPGAALVRVDDPAKSVSKTHALLQLDGERLFVHDLGSTNGVYVVEPGREAVEVRPDHRVQLSGDGDLELGEYLVKVRRR